MSDEEDTTDSGYSSWGYSSSSLSPEQQFQDLRILTHDVGIQTECDEDSRREESAMTTTDTTRPREPLNPSRRCSREQLTCSTGSSEKENNSPETESGTDKVYQDPSTSRDKLYASKELMQTQSNGLQYLFTGPSTSTAAFQRERRSSREQVIQSTESSDKEDEALEIETTQTQRSVQYLSTGPSKSTSRPKAFRRARRSSREQVIQSTESSDKEDEALETETMQTQRNVQYFFTGPCTSTSRPKVFRRARKASRDQVVQSTESSDKEDDSQETEAIHIPWDGLQNIFTGPSASTAGGEAFRRIRRFSHEQHPYSTGSEDDSQETAPSHTLNKRKKH